jgi:type I restriction enzyme, S subunit
MTLRRYQRYKDSGVEWLGPVPAHWEVLPLKRDIEFLTSGARGWAENYTDEGDLFIRIGNLTRDSIRLDLTDIQRVVVPNGAEGSRTQVRAGDVLFSITAYLGSVAVVPGGLEKAYVSQHVALVRPTRKRLLPEWIAYVAASYVGKTYFETQGYGGTKIQLSLDDVANLLVTVPALPEQVALVSYLEFETAKIDKLIAEQQRLIELLTEKRQAVIAHAVTKGLNPAAPMKASGVEWLGGVPSHWPVGPLRRAFSSINYGISESLDVEGRIAVLRMGNIGGGEVILEDLKYVDSVDAGLLLRGGDLLFNRTNSLDQIGKVGLFRTDSAEPTTFASYLVRLRTADASVPEYFAYLLNCSGVLGEARANAIVAIGQCNLNPTRYGAFTVAVPPRVEQLSIATFLDAECAKLDLLMQEAGAATELLRERRSAIISAAVTGQIDVRPTGALEAALSESAAGRFVVDSSAAHVARVSAMAQAGDIEPLP